MAQTFSRRNFIQFGAVGIAALFGFKPRPYSGVMTVTGLIHPSAMGTTLIHEHILVDFIGAAQISSTRWEHEKVINKSLPFLKEVKAMGCDTLIDCTPNFLGRDAKLLRKLTELSGLKIITNTGFYGGSDNKFLPAEAFSETAEKLSQYWVREWENGIDETGVKPGFIKISVNPGSLSDISRKLIRAAAITHLRTGLPIASHTGPALPAFEQLKILNDEGVNAEAFIWVHAQNERDHTQFSRAARTGCWVSLDGLNDNNVPDYISMLEFLKKEKCLHRVLVSHDAGWYDPAKADGGDFRGYTTLFKRLIPSLQQKKFKDTEISQLIRSNPKKAFTIAVKKV